MNTIKQWIHKESRMVSALAILLFPITTPIFLLFALWYASNELIKEFTGDLK